MRWDALKRSDDSAVRGDGGGGVGGVRAGTASPVLGRGGFVLQWLSGNPPGRAGGSGVIRSYCTPF